jgi:hypothetical protein
MWEKKGGIIEDSAFIAVFHFTFNSKIFNEEHNSTSKEQNY